MRELTVFGKLLLGNALVPGSITIVDDRIADVRRGGDADRARTSLRTSLRRV